MEIKDLQAKQGDVELTAEVVEKAQVREFNKNGNVGKVCNAKLKDATGTVSLTLWNDEIDQVNVGDTIKLSKGYVGEWQGELQLSAGRFGTIEVVKKGEPQPEQPAEPKPDVQPDSDMKDLEPEEESF